MKSSLLDIYYSSIPQYIEGVVNIVNIMSEHDGVRINLHTEEKLSKPQFSTRRIYSKVTYDNLMLILDENKTRGSEVDPLDQLEEIQILSVLLPVLMHGLVPGRF